MGFFFSFFFLLLDNVNKVRDKKSLYAVNCDLEMEGGDVDGCCSVLQMSFLAGVIPVVRVLPLQPHH